MSTLEELHRAFRPADAFDIAFLALFLYTLFMWFRATASRQVLMGIAVLAAIYLIARTFDMYMTAALFQAALTFTAVALIVIFQEDLRRAFARIAAFGKLPRLGDSDRITADCDVLVETVFELAEKKVGALLVLRGDEPLERHIRGGHAEFLELILTGALGTDRIQRFDWLVYVFAVLVLPGPAFVAIPLGLAMLSSRIVTYKRRVSDE